MQASQQPSAKDFGLIKKGTNALLMLKELLLSGPDNQGMASAALAMQCHYAASMACS